MKKLLIVLLSMALVATACAHLNSQVPITGSIPPSTPEAGPTDPTSPSGAGTDETVTTTPAGGTNGAGEAEPVGCIANPGDVGAETGEGLLPIDPEVRIGTLDNGLTYYLRSNDSPGGNLALRLAVNAGSLNEPVVGSGIAHYLEHMLFNGTEKFPGNELSAALHGIGVEFGPDINAFTSYDETVYQLDLLIDEQERSVATAFEVLSQWAHAATIDPQDVEEERGIVRDEYRLGVETGSSMVISQFDRSYTTDTPYAGRAPIGTAANIESITARQLRDFYETWYVPSNMAVIAVGDLPLDTLEGLVEEYFCAIPAGEAPPAPDNRSALNPEPVFDVATSPEQGYSYLSLDIRLPSWDPTTIDGDRRMWIEEIIGIMVGNRLQDGYEQGYLSQIDPTHWTTFSHARGLRYYGTNLRADDYATALTDYWSLLLSLKEHGFTGEDLARADETIRAYLRSVVQAVPTMQDARYADQYASHFLDGNDIGRLTDTAERVGALLNEIRVDDLNNRYREILDESGPILIAVGADPADLPTEEEMASALDAAEPGDLPAPTTDADELLTIPDPVDADVAGPLDVLPGAYEWSFANGARVMFVPSRISENKIDLQAISWGGWSALESGDFPLAQVLLAVRAVRNSGAGDLSPAQLSRYLDGRNVTVQPFIGETTEGFAGASDSGDVETMFQLLYLYMTEPRLDRQAFAEAINTGENRISLAISDPDWRSQLAYLEARYGDAFDWYDPIAPRTTLDSITPEALLDLYRQRLGDVDDLVVMVVGDVGRATVEEMARTYVGTLPAGEADGFVNRRPPEPAGVVRREIRLGPDTRATSATYYYETPIIAVTPAAQAAADVLEVLLNDRLVEDIRENLGDSYTVLAQVDLRTTPEPMVESQVLVSGDPERMADIETDLVRILADVTSGGITRDEFEHARSVVADDYNLINNYDLINVLLRRVHADDDELPTPRRMVDELSDLESADVGELAALLYDPEQHIQIVRVLP